MNMVLDEGQITQQKTTLLSMLRVHRDIAEIAAKEIAEITGANDIRMRRNAHQLLLEEARDRIRMGSPLDQEFAKKALSRIKTALIEIAKTPEEIQPARSNKKGRAEILERTTELNLARAWRDHRNSLARERLLLAYRPLAITMAAKVAKINGMEINELANEAYAEMALRFDSFDPEKENSFGTFVRRHIQGCLNKYAMDNNGPVRAVLNANDKRAWFRYRRARIAWEAANQRTLDDQGKKEIAEQINVPIRNLLRFEARVSGGDVSMDDIIAEREGTTRGSLMSNHDPTPEDVVQERLDRVKLAGFLATFIEELPEREKMVIRARFCDNKIDFSELGRVLGITKERVRQIEQRGTKRLRERLEQQGFRVDDLNLGE